MFKQMIQSKRIRSFTNRFPLVGPLVWVSSWQFFITQFVVASNWPVAHSYKNNAISDLGNTVCGLYGGRYVCSPWHTWMNASFIVLGITMAVGSVLIYHEFKRTTWSWFGFEAMMLGGLGTILVGLFPENSVGFLHGFGAFLPFFVGNISLIILGLCLDIPKYFKIYSVFSGVLALTAFVLFTTGNYAGLGLGGMERLVAHPQTIWLIAFGIYMTKNRYKS